MSIITIKNLTKYYGRTKALENINLTIEENKIYGLLGRNGAGKTTLLNIITNKLFPCEGDIQVNGESVFENENVLNKIFYMMEKNLYPESLKIKEVFSWTRAFYPNFDMDYAKELSQRFGLDTNKTVKGLSTGYASIFKAITALASNTEILILDEPVLGLDAYHRDMFYKVLLENYLDKPKTIIISTHLIEEIADVLEETIIIKSGQIIEQRSVEDLLLSAYTVSGEESKVDQFIQEKNYVGIETMGKFKSATVIEPLDNNIKSQARSLGLDISKPELQKLFINLTNS
ncbi:ABC transporter ATP-binding protein [Serpentinicella sp. ANB-PHB4]|uniref:ABC transporter ATP-binding protein n=1 Tax=Serpentinicella sp. ANB-PHB4 TaxID=3074076 RepID=UPI0028660547|nr:ABC transporter ATP-binding protein [Serpentinicella sp. ANB-PHB4]MDR5659049.1 ABC transporter ATP-binding protein [Serpentinicella sp. ANB-PHB4]